MSQLVPSEGSYENIFDESTYALFSMYPTFFPDPMEVLKEEPGFDDEEDEDVSMLVSLDGLPGVPTRTTPTLTPTTLKKIEQDFLEQSFLEATLSHGREAGFVPPLVEPPQPASAQTHNPAIHQHQQHHQQPQPQQLHHHHQQQHQQHLQSTETSVHKTQHDLLLENQQNIPQNQQFHLQSCQEVESHQTERSPQQNRRNMGGRRPTRTVGMSPEEEERRQIRRERNKMAAARCRKRRLDHTNSLLQETDGLEQKKQSLHEEIQQLTQTKDELEYILESHRKVCRIHSSSPPDIKPIVKPEIQSEEQFTKMDCKQIQAQQAQTQALRVAVEEIPTKPNRPNSLPVGFDNNNRPNVLPIFTEPKTRPRPNSLHFKTVDTPTFMKSSNNEIAGVPITTPSNGIPFNFDSLMEGGTGLTPVSTPLVPSCSSQQRNNSMTAVDLTSPDTHHPPKLVSL